MTNDENTYIGMSLPEGIRYITVFEKGDFENCGRNTQDILSYGRQGEKIALLGEPAPIWEAVSHQNETRQAVGL